MEQNEKVDTTRRMLIRGVLVGSAVAFLGSALGLGRYTVPPPPTLQPFPRVLLGKASQLQVGQPYQYKYPLANQPNIIVKIGKKAQFGVGPDHDIVSFSNICQHLGCIYVYENNATCPNGATFPGGHCPCHGSHYNFLENGKVMCGPAPRPVPRVILEYDPVTDNIWAIGMAPPTIFGFNTGSDNVAYDLIGGPLIPDGSQANLTPL
ncbi:hypothetical protein B9Q11_02615 [Candidatus Marsarchaeota G2 archaeon ECH_B_SAG-F08]|uniref:Rieske domain-containing protein n=3 Tax=Candidatus Marsarchaeota TaxID=1978152 RepID=A0A2R6BHY1_9ARCH|nr:MAG: hypothetical protein B9Q01_03505 [Candidatus Marsarchaeota G1 archaeon OSP_D]PSN87861.1 MAG: hypothetical protein B9Q00_07590 [Candidatus Marsarchaeota G1 archaeon OSP_C]PSN98232.1 MAG: hypothetical protein B9Q11_02615 [Candidatus Marsarchaeota G2 archaeon ECH_B_SAG-F08]